MIDYQATYVDMELEPWTTGLPRSEAPDFRLYPNPASDILYLEAVNLPPGELILSIHSLDGRTWIRKELSWQGEALEIDISRLDNGLYLVRSSTPSKQFVHRLLVIGP